MNLIDQPMVDAETERVLDMGIRVFNGALFGADEREHVDVLLEALNPPIGAMVIDMGCGVGEMARLMHEQRPDLEFLLVNTSRVQLENCPEDFDRLLADFHRLPVLDGQADAVIFSYAICHSGDWPLALAEAYRLLKPGGILFINDMARLSGDNAEFEQFLGGRVHAPEQVEEWAANAGFVLDMAIAPTIGVDRLRGLMNDDALADRLTDGVVPTIWRFRSLLDDTARTLHRHRGRVAFQFSGGRDSTAALHLLQPYWDLMRVYHVDTGDHFPETKEVVARMEELVLEAGGSFIRIQTDVKRDHEENGWPSDLLPAQNTFAGRLLSGRTLRLQGRFDCCARNLMLPLHQRMKDDGITLLIRGQRNEEYVTTPLRSGDKGDGFEMLYPIETWDSEMVMTYLDMHSLPVADSFYDSGMQHGSDCMTCSAWWDEGRAAFLRRHHPNEHVILMSRMDAIQEEVTASFEWLCTEREA